MNIFQGTDELLLKEKFFVFVNSLSFSIFCECHRKILNRKFLGFKVGKFILLTSTKIVSFEKKRFKIIQISSSEIATLILHFYSFFDLKINFNEFFKAKIYRNKFLNFFFDRFFSKKKTLLYETSVRKTSHTCSF